MQTGYCLPPSGTVPCPILQDQPKRPLLQEAFPGVPHALTGQMTLLEVHGSVHPPHSTDLYELQVLFILPESSVGAGSNGLRSEEEHIHGNNPNKHSNCKALCTACTSSPAAPPWRALMRLHFTGANLASRPCCAGIYVCVRGQVIYPSEPVCPCNHCSTWPPALASGFISPPHTKVMSSPPIL